MPTKTFLRLDETKQETILRAAVREFLRSGFDHCKVSDIAAAAGIAKGSIYQYFENKKEFFLHTVHWTLEYYLQKLGRRTDDFDMDIFDYFRLNNTRRDVMREEPELTWFIQRVFLGEYRSVADEAMEKMLKISDEYTLHFIRNGQRKGTIRTDIDDHLMLLFFTGAVVKIKEHWMRCHPDLTQKLIDSGATGLEHEVEALAELLRHGLSARRDEECNPS